MPEDLDERLKKAVAERERISSEAQRVAGRKEAAERALASVEGEIRAKNLDPETLEETVQKLETAFEASVTRLEQDTAAYREALAPYQETK